MMSNAVVIDQLPDDTYLSIYSGQDITVDAGEFFRLLKSVYSRGLQAGVIPVARQPQLEMHLPGLATSGPGQITTIFGGPCSLCLDFPDLEDAVLYRMQMDG
jgi:hypothetical protein